MRENKIHIATPFGHAPALVLSPDHSAGTIIVYHGLTASKEVQRKELQWLAEAGFTPVCVDAPHHGERRDGYLETLSSATTTDQHFMVMKLVFDATQEIPAIVDFCLQHFSGNVGIAGISLGGFIAYRAPVIEPRIKAAVPILGSPDWSPKEGSLSPEMRSLTEQAPVRVPEGFPPCAVFAANAGKDVFVPPQPSRDFFHVLQNHYHAFPERLSFLEYPDSEHMMREEDWNDLWKKVIQWFHRFLG